MKVVTLRNAPDVPVEGADRIEGWTGPVSRSRQTIVEPGTPPTTTAACELQPRLHDRLAYHSCDQILVVTSGSGMAATEHEQHEINVGDVVHVKAGEAPLAWRQGQYDDGAYHHYGRRRQTTGDSRENDNMSRPRALENIRVVDFSWVRAGPWATRWLGALGAEIIKIEWPESERGRLPEYPPRRGTPRSI
jgi:hypothetical protein